MKIGEACYLHSDSVNAAIKSWLYNQSSFPIRKRIRSCGTENLIVELDNEWINRFLMLVRLKSASMRSEF